MSGMSPKTTGTIVTTPAHSSFLQVGFFLKIRRLKKMIWTFDCSEIRYRSYARQSTSIRSCTSAMHCTANCEE